MSYRNSTGNSLNSRLKDIWEDARLGRRIAQAAAGFGAFSPLLVLASPTGGQVVAGSASISSPSANGTVINQSSQRAVINWQQFSVGANQYVQFVQPDSSAVVLNRVISNDPSRIFGDITANGQVFLINPNGILFGKGAVLDAAGVVASTLDIRDSDFMQGNYTFAKGTDAPDAMVLNQGSLTAARGGYVVLAGDYVENDGHIQAQTGRVYLAAGASATMTLDRDQLISYTVDSATLASLAGVVNAGDIVATGGAVVMTGDVANALTATAVNNQGYIGARSIQNRAGVIVLVGVGGETVNSGTLDASGDQVNVTGGTILVRSNEETHLLPTSVIDTEGDGANGGFVDISGHDLGLHGKLKVGKGGALLLDPSTITIEPGSGPGGSTSNCSGCEGGVIHTSYLQRQLNLGVNMTIIASGSIKNSGATAITATAGAGKLALKIGHASGGTGVASLHHITSSIFSNQGSLTEHFLRTTGGIINIAGLNINIKGAFQASASHGQVTLGNVAAGGGIAIRGEQITVGNLSAPGKSITMGSSLVGVFNGAFIKAPGKTFSAKNVSLTLAGSYGGLISIGAVNAASSAHINMSSNNGTNTIRTGAITAPRINISEFGKADVVTTGALTAVNAAGSASIDIFQTVITGGTGHVTVNGDITVSGKPNGGIGQYNLPKAATLKIESTGSGSGAHTITVNGSINVTAIPGLYGATPSANEGGPVKGVHQGGTGGVANVFIVADTAAGSAAVTGAITETGPDAFAVVQAHNVSLGNITVTGTGHQVSRNLVTRTSKSSFTGQSYTSTNNAGQAAIIVGDAGVASYGGPTGVLKVGNVSVSGKGVAEALLFGSQVTAGNITVTATAATGTVKQHGNIGGCTSNQCDNLRSSGFYSGIGPAVLRAGTLNAGRADIVISSHQGGSGGSSSGAPGVSIKTGALSATGVGQGFISLSAKTIQTQGLTVVSTKGKEQGSGSSQSGVTAVTTYAHTFNGSGGVAGIKIRSGNSGSHSSGIITQNGGPVTINGAISAKGPRATVDIKGKTITVGGTVTVAGSGGTLTSTTKVTGPNGGFSTSFSGPERPTSLNLQGAASGSVDVAGKIDVKGPGLVGVIVIGGGVTLHGLSGSASAVKTYVTKDTRISTTKTTNTVGSLAVFVDDVSVAGGALTFTSAADTGDVTLLSKGNVDMATRINVNGNLDVAAVGNINGSSNGVVARFNAAQNQVRVGNNSSGGGPSPGVLPTAGFKANAMAMVAGKNINMSGSQLTIGNGSISSVHGDAELLLGLAGLGLSPAAPNPNGEFKAGGVSLGGLKLTGSYLWLQGTAVSILGPVSVPAGALVQVVPSDPTAPIDIEDRPAASSVLTLTASSSTFSLTNSGFISLFPNTTIVVGQTGETGDATLGADGPMNIGATNLLIFTEGSVTGLGTVTSTGIVNSLLSILGPPIPPVTSGEIDPSTGLGDQTDKKKFGGTGGVDTGNGQGDTISQDTSTASVCH